MMRMRERKGQAQRRPPRTFRTRRTRAASDTLGPPCGVGEYSRKAACCEIRFIRKSFDSKAIIRLSYFLYFALIFNYLLL